MSVKSDIITGSAESGSRSLKEWLGSLVPATADTASQVMFTEIPVPEHNTVHSISDQTIDFQPEAVIRKGDLVIAVKNSVSDRLLDRLLEGVSHAC